MRQIITSILTFLSIASASAGISLSNGFMSPFHRAGSTAKLGFIIKSTSGDISSYKLSFSVDGKEVTTVDESKWGTLNTSMMYVVVDVTLPYDLSTGRHTYTLQSVEENGAAVTDGSAITGELAVYKTSVSKQAYLLEHFTATWCTNCQPIILGIENLMSFHDDIAWVSVHSDASDPYYCTTASEFKSIDGVTAYPKAFTDRHGYISIFGYADQTQPYRSNSTPDKASADDFYNTTIKANAYPAFANLDIKSSFDAKTRDLTVTVDMTSVPDFESIFGKSALTVCLTEDKIKGYQTSLGTIDHNAVLRCCLTPSKGDELEWTDDACRRTYTYKVPESYVAENMNVIAFIGRTLPSGVSEYERYVTNAAKVPMQSGEIDDAIGHLHSTEATPVAHYDICGRKKDGNGKGLTVVRYSDGTTRKVIK